VEDDASRRHLKTMFNVCPSCGQYSDDKHIDVAASVATCASCGHRHPFKRLPLFIITGASCTGKSTVGLRLPDSLPDFVPLESDILWRQEFNQPDNDFIEYRNLWLRLAKNIGQAGRPVILIGSAAPGQFERCTESRYFSAIKYLVYICGESELERRLKARPQWRQSGSEEVVKAMVAFNQWLKEHSEDNSEVAVLDTTHCSPDETLDSTVKWLRSMTASQW
jgi:hypothetical protein